VRLACVRRAANVRSEPGSNSPVVETVELLSEDNGSIWHCRCRGDRLGPTLDRSLSRCADFYIESNGFDDLRSRRLRVTPIQFSKAEASFILATRGWRRYLLQPLRAIFLFRFALSLVSEWQLRVVTNEPAAFPGAPERVGEEQSSWDCRSVKFDPVSFSAPVTFLSAFVPSLGQPRRRGVVRDPRSRP
jgi:hypothetical protein